MNYIKSSFCGGLENKVINEKCKLDILKIHFKRILLYEAETWPTTIAKFKPRK
jgi:hypothetical protein